MQTIVYSDSAVSCTKNSWTNRDAVWDAQSGGSRERIIWGVDASMGRGTFGVSSCLQNLVKHSILWGWVKGWAVHKNGRIGRTDLNNLYIVWYEFL